MTEARGTFVVKMAPVAGVGAEGVAGMTLTKTYSGDLQASGVGQMLSAGNPATGNAGYVAMERITGTLAGRSGSFALMQAATMATGTEPRLTATIVPGSGTGELSGIAGSMTLAAVGKDHVYTIAYNLSR